MLLYASSDMHLDVASWLILHCRPHKLLIVDSFFWGGGVLVNVFSWISNWMTLKLVFSLSGQSSSFVVSQTMRPVTQPNTKRAALLTCSLWNYCGFSFVLAHIGRWASIILALHRRILFTNALLTYTLHDFLLERMFGQGGGLLFVSSSPSYLLLFLLATVNKGVESTRGLFI